MNNKQLTIWRLLITLALVTLLIAVIGCGDDPVSPDLSVEPVDTINLSDAPPIPEPAVPGQDPGDISTIMTTVSVDSIPNFTPYITRAQVNWIIAGRLGAGESFSNTPDTAWCDWNFAVDGELWSDDSRLIQYTYYMNPTTGCDVQLSTCGAQTVAPEWQNIYLTANNFNTFPNWHKLITEGSPTPGTPWELTSSARSTSSFSCGFIFGSDFLSQYQLARGYREIQAVPHLRRDRFWRRKQLEGGAGSYLLLSGPVSGEIETSYTQGVSRTQTESFGRSITASVGGDFKAFSVEVEATLEQTFETSLEISEETSVTFTKTVSSETGQTVQFMVWELVDIYSISDADGNPLSDPNYEFALPLLEVKGIAVALDATVWTD